MNKSGLYMKYFVLKPEGTDIYAYASRMALREYAKCLDEGDPELSRGLKEWASDTGRPANMRPQS